MRAQFAHRPAAWRTEFDIGLRTVPSCPGPEFAKVAVGGFIRQSPDRVAGVATWIVGFGFSGISSRPEVAPECSRVLIQARLEASAPGLAFFGRLSLLFAKVRGSSESYPLISMSVGAAIYVLLQQELLRLSRCWVLVGFRREPIGRFKWVLVRLRIPGWTRTRACSHPVFDLRCFGKCGAGLAGPCPPTKLGRRRRAAWCLGSSVSLSLAESDSGVEALSVRGSHGGRPLFGGEAWSNNAGKEVAGVQFSVRRSTPVHFIRRRGLRCVWLEGFFVPRRSVVKT